MENKIYKRRGIMPHIRGIPPAPNWGNGYTAIIIENSLLYIANSYIVNIDLVKKEFFQMINCNSLENNDRLNVLCKLNPNNFLTVSSKGYFICFQKYLNQDKTYFKESKSHFKYKSVRTIIANVKENRLFCADGNGNLFSYIYSTNNDDFDLKSLISINLGLNNIIMCLLNHNELLFLGMNSGRIFIYSYLSDNLEKLLEIEGEKTIFSMDIYMKDDFELLLYTLDKSGSLNCTKIFQDESLNYSYESISLERNKFNDKSIDEKFIFFCIRVLNRKIIVTSNKGKILMKKINEDIYTEISDNPHKMNIFNILEFNDKIITISSDWIISCFNKDLIFEYDIKTFGSVPKQISYYEVIYVLTDDYLLRYSYKKLKNGLFCTVRNIHGLINISQAEYSENILALRYEDHIDVYDYNSDVVINRYFHDNKALDLLFHSNREYQSVNHFNEKVMKSLKNIFSEKNIYELLYIYTNKCVIIWDYILNKTNCINISFNSKIIPIKLDNNDILIFHRNKNELKMTLFNQIIFYEILSIIHDIECTFDFFMTHENLFIFIIIGHDLIIHNYKKEFVSLLISDCNISENYNNYKKRLEILNQLSQIKPDELNYKNLSSATVSILSVNKEYFYENDSLIVKFLINQTDGVIKVYLLDSSMKLVLKYSINSHILKIIDSVWLDHNSIATISNDHSLKIWNLDNCKIVDIVVEYKNNSKTEGMLKLITNFTKLSSICLYQQSYKESQNQAINFKEKYANINESDINLENENIEFLLFSIFKSPELNFMTGTYSLLYEYNRINETMNTNKIFNSLINILYYAKIFNIEINFSTFKHKSDILLEFEKDLNSFVDKYSTCFQKNLLTLFNERNYNLIINLFLESDCYIEAIVIYKLSRMSDYNLYFTIIEKLKSHIYSKQIFQTKKFQLINETLKNYIVY